MSDMLINGLGSVDTYDSKTSAALDKINNKDYSNASDEELKEVCQEFEAYFIEQMFQAMEKMSHITDEEEEEGGVASNYASQMQDYFQDELVTQYSKNAADSNGGEGLGIAQMLYEQMKRNYSL